MNKSNTLPKSLKIRPFLFVIFLSLIANSRLAYSQIGVITERLRSDLIGQSVDDNDVSRYLNTLKNDGSWADIDYSDRSHTNWQPASHSGRLKLICTAYNKPSSVYFHVADVKVKIRKIIDFYKSAKPKSDNWWFNAIGAPINLGPALVLMKTDDKFGFDQATLASYADSLINYYTESAIKWPHSTTGANKIWLLKSSIDKACVKENELVLLSNFQSAFEEAKIMDGKNEGIKSDYSFYQHGKQLYCGGYGMSFMGDITTFGTLAFGTTYQMSNSQLKVLTDEILDGFQWFCQKSAFDFGAVGREISRHGAGSSSGIKTFVTRLKGMNAPRLEELTNCYNFINGTADFQNPGNRYFWKSDIMVHHGSSFYLSARIPSSRTVGTEMMNKENLKRKYLPWGATNIMIEGNEYHNIFAVWDWSRIPGVTSFREDVAADINGGAYLNSTSGFAGGVSDDVYGLAAYDYSWDGINGRKAYFFTPEAMYCLGAGISTSKSNPVITSVNQCFSSGVVTVNKNNVKSTIDGTETLFSNLKWIHHNRVGYLFPTGGEITVKNMNQTGSWNDINTSQSSDPITQKVFSAWISHGNSPVDGKYEYIVVPSKDVSQFEKWTENNPLKMIVNSKDIQAVCDKKAGIFAIVFYGQGTITLEPGFSVSVDKTCLLLIQSESKGEKYKISVSDPTYSLQNVTIGITKKLLGQGAINNSDNSSTLNISFPSGDETGRTVTNEYSVQ